MNFIIFDLECTCWEGRPADKTMEIIEIGAVKLDEFGDYMDSFTRFVRPKIHPVLSNFCQQLTSISQIDINRAEPFPYVVEDFMEWVDIDADNYWLCSWGGFDKRQMAADCTLHEIESAWTDFHLNIKQQYLDYKGIRRPIGLKKAVEREGFEFTGIHHRAISDAENLAKLFVKFRDVWQF
jgi:inhibitor of KinA sporulation pathway (predicted exonuclease)